jgi:hypothetical protein
VERKNISEGIYSSSATASVGVSRDLLELGARHSERDTVALIVAFPTNMMQEICSTIFLGHQVMQMSHCMLLSIIQQSK